YATVKAGDPITAYWNQVWPHPFGPMLADTAVLKLTYLALCPGTTCTGVNAGTLKWFKIDESGLINGTVFNGYWGSGKMIDQNSSWTTTIPATVPSATISSVSKPLPFILCLRLRQLLLPTSSAPTGTPGTVAQFGQCGGGKTFSTDNSAYFLQALDIRDRPDASLLMSARSSTSTLKVQHNSISETFKPCRRKEIPVTVVRLFQPSKSTQSE
ncbi:glycosyl hydrolase family 61-domain-containing protein, partial [Mycena albidolilacea]